MTNQNHKSVSYMRISSSDSTPTPSGFQDGGATASAYGKTFACAADAKSQVDLVESYRISRQAATQSMSRMSFRSGAARYRMAG